MQTDKKSNGSHLCWLLNSIVYIPTYLLLLLLLNFISLLLLLHKFPSPSSSLTNFPPPPPPQFYFTPPPSPQISLLLLLLDKFPSSSSSSTILFHSPSSTNFPPPPPPPLFLPNFIVSITKTIKHCALAHFVTMSRVVKNNRGFFQLLAECSPEQCQFLLMTATPQQMHALVQVILNVLHENLPISEEERRKLIQSKDALVNLALADIPYKTKKQTLVQEGGDLFKIC